ncbi:MAG TPA: hypothetical protein VG840_13475 [Casimicrobiaceae bacterium]|nr:hypothetical protein [Casimicrobiaceae bacterium]
MATRTVAWWILVACVALMGLATSAEAHYGHSVRALAAIGHLTAGVPSTRDFVTGALPHRLELHAPGCPGDGSGNCCCTQDAHVPLPSSQFVLPAATVRFATPARVARRVVEVPAIPVARPTVIGSRGSRGPPSPSSFR